MRSVERVGIKKLKNNLSSYIQQARKGVRVLVTDREEVVAELGRPTSEALPDGLPAVLLEWIRAGEVIPARRRKRPVPRSVLKLKPGTAARILDELRGE